MTLVVAGLSECARSYVKYAFMGNNNSESQDWGMNPFLVAGIYALSFISITAIWFASYPIVKWWSKEMLHKNSPQLIAGMGTTGDAFGAVNSLFSALALAGLIVTIILQNSAIKLQRIELRNSIEGMNQQKKQEIFFLLINSLDAASENFSTRDSNGSYSGYNAFANLKTQAEQNAAYIENPKKNIVQTYSEMIKIYSNNLSPYFNILEHTLKIIDKDLNGEQQYADIIVVKMTPPELELVKYYETYDLRPTLTPLLKKYFSSHMKDIRWKI